MAKSTELNQEIRSILKENCNLLEQALRELNSNKLVYETLSSELDLIKDILHQLSNLVKDDADSSLVIRITRLESIVAGLLVKDEPKGNSRAVMVALITAVTAILVQVVEALSK